MHGTGFLLFFPPALPQSCGSSPADSRLPALLLPPPVGRSPRPASLNPEMGWSRGCAVRALILSYLVMLWGFLGS